jgi:Protein of unknown function (DUF3455)
MRTPLFSFTLAILILPASVGGAEIPGAIAASGEALVATIRAEGTQVYECKADPSGRLAWQFREPIAMLFEDDKTVGRHFAGPSWAFDDGSTVQGKVTGRAPGASANDIPLLRLEVTSRQGSGQLSEVTTIQRLNTRGGVAQGACERAGVLHSAPYSADYLFYKKKG